MSVVAGWIGQSKMSYKKIEENKKIQKQLHKEKVKKMITKKETK